MYRSFEKETIEGDASLAEEGVQEVVCHGHLVFRIDIRLADAQYDIFEVQLVHGGCGFLVRGPRTQDRTLIVFYLEYVKLGFCHRARHPKLASGHEITSIRKICPVL